MKLPHGPWSGSFTFPAILSGTPAGTGVTILPTGIRGALTTGTTTTDTIITGTIIITVTIITGTSPVTHIIMTIITIRCVHTLLLSATE